jgi:hypothetical protein
MTHPDTQAPSDLTMERVRAARRWANFYQSRGFMPLPSTLSEPGSKRKGHPPCKFGAWWEGGGPSADDLWARWPCPNIQIMTGRHWRLAAIDLDGPDAIDAFTKLGPTIPRTWESTSGGGGRHLWFSLPDGLPEMPKRLIWQGGGHHSAIELLCDRSLLMAPPSIHPSGRLYRFRAQCSPRVLTRPAMIPKWILDLPDVRKAESASAPVPNQAPRPERKVLSGPMPNWMDRQDVLMAIADKVSVARSWGLRIAERSSESNGWISCHDFDREDRTPSARFHPLTGRFWRPGMIPMSLFDLGVALGHYADWRSCCADLASIYLPDRSSHVRCDRG